MDYQEEYNQMMKNGGGQKRFQYIVVGVIAFVLGFGIAWVSFKSQTGNGPIVQNENKDNNRVDAVVNVSKPQNSKDSKKDDSSVSAPVVSGDVALSVLDQAPGKTVFVTEVSAPTAVWVVVAEDNGGVRGNILGAGLFDPEDQAGVVNLLRGTVEGGSYYAGLYSEDSDLTQNRIFDLESDLPLLDANGNNIEVQFKTSVSPTE